MLLWLICGALTALAAAVIVQPFISRRAPLAVASAASIYRDQLSELEREAKAGELPTQQAEEARREIARRLLAADAAEQKPARTGLRHEAAVGLALAGIVPVVAFAFYGSLGSPDIQGAPMASRDMDAAINHAPASEVAESLFEKLIMDPNHPDHWMQLGRIYMGLERYGEAAAAFARALALLGDKAPAMLWSAYGEAQALAAGGRITPDARKAFEQAVKRDPKDPAGRFYLANAKAQDGDNAGAIADLKALEADLPAGSDQHQDVEARIAALSGVPTQGRAPKDNAAIHGMVDGLAAKLEADPQNLDGWLLLITSYVKLEEPDKAKAALAKAKDVFKDNHDALKALDAKAAELGLT